MNLWKVYCYTGKNNKKYIGITSQTIQTRAGINGYNYQRDNFKFGNAIQKYGFDFFTCEILEDNLSFEEAKEKEKYYIELYDTYNNGYNSTLGGEGRILFDKDKIISLWQEGKTNQEIIQIIGCGKDTVTNTLTSAHINSKERISRVAGQYHTRKVYQYDLDGNFIAEYNSISEAGRITNIQDTNIGYCLQGKRKSAGGFQWKNEKRINIEPYNKNKGNHSKVIYQYDLNNNLINAYDQVSDAAKALNRNSTYLARIARKNGIAYGYKWSYSLL